MGRPFDAQVARLLDPIRKGRIDAHSRLLMVASPLIHELISRATRGHPDVRRWAAGEGFLQRVMVRLFRELRDATPESPAQFHLMAATQVRLELSDLAGRHSGP